MLRTKLRRYTKAGLECADLYQFWAAQHIHHVGNDNYYGLPFDLETWQRDYIWRPIFASGKADSGGTFWRAFTTAIISMPRNFGKTEIACCIILTIANMEVRYNGQYGIIASSEPQARKILKTLKAMVALDPDLKALWEPLKGKMVNRDTGAEIIVFPYSESAVQSWHFNVVIADELHVWRGPEVWDAIQSGMKDIPNALCLGITTAGSEQRGFLWDKFAAGPDADPTTYMWWHGANAKDKIDDRRVWARLALPSWVTVESIGRQFVKLSSMQAFERYVLNRYPEVKGEEVAIKTGAVNRCAKREAEFDWSHPFAVGIDGATSGDTLAICAYQRQGERDVFAEWAWQEPDESGYYDFMEVADVIEMLGKRRGMMRSGRVPCIGLDPARMVLLMKYVERERDVKTFVLKQQPSIMCPASSMLKHSIESGRACLGSTPVLAEHARNCLRDENKAYGMRFTSKGSGKTKRRIDMAIAASMAMYIYENAEQGRDYMGAQFVF